MTWFIAGSPEGSTIRVEQAGEFPRLVDFTASLPAGARNVLQIQDGWTDAVAAAESSTIVGGTVHTTTGAFTLPTAIPVDAAGQKLFAASWYVDAMVNHRQEHWPYATATNGERTRSQQVNNIELPHWLADQYGLMVAVADGEVFPTYTDQQKVALFTHMDTLLRGGIVQTWYQAGIGLDTNDSNATGWRTDSRGYSDFVTDAGVLRTPDYSWTSIPRLAAAMAASTFSLPVT